MRQPTRTAPAVEPLPTSAAELYERSARRVLEARGLSGDALEAAIVRLRAVEPSFRLPSPADLRSGGPAVPLRPDFGNGRR